MEFRYGWEGLGVDGEESLGMDSLGMDGRRV